MKLSGNTIVITGGSSGIGLGLAKAFAKEGNKVVITARGKAKLDKAVAEHPQLSAYVMDVADNNSVKSAAAAIVKDFPGVNVVINNAGIARPENMLGQDYLDTAEAIIDTNYLGMLRVTSAFMPQLLTRDDATIMNVSSGLAYLPIAPTPTYCASKAAMASYVQTLRVQLSKTNVKVIELVPPAVKTDLGGGGGSPFGMDLDVFIGEVMDLLKANPNAEQLCVKDVRFMRFAEAEGRYAEAFKMINQQAAKAFSQ